MWQGKSHNFHNFFFCNNIIFHNLQLFLPQQYNFSQFAAFSSHNLYSKGSNRSSPAYKPQSKYGDEDRYTIAKYAKDNGASQVAKFFNNKYPTINESTV